MPYLSQLPYRFIMPDLLGHGGTSKPTDPSAYAYHLMVEDIIEILDVEGINFVIPLGHDHGSVLAQRIYNRIPERIAALIMLNVAYSPPAKAPFNLFATNAMTKQVFGYGCAEYFHFLTSPDAARLMENDLDRVWDIPHAKNFSDMRDIYGVPNGMRRYLQDATVPRIELKPYAKQGHLKGEWKDEIEKGGLEAPLCWYTAMVQQVQYESDKSILEENARVNVPTLFIGCGGDAPCRAELIKPSIEAGLLPHLTTHVLQEVGHWPMYEDPEGTATHIVAFLEIQLKLT